MQTIEVSGQRFELASLWERWLGQFLDGVICFTFFFIPFILTTLLGLEEIGAAIAIIFAIFYLLLQDGLENGQSYGKKIAKTKAIHSRTGLPCTFGQSFIRNLLLAITGIIGMLYILDEPSIGLHSKDNTNRNLLLTIIGTIDWIFILGEKRQRLGDKAARTLVVKISQQLESADLSDNRSDISL